MKLGETQRLLAVMFFVVLALGGLPFLKGGFYLGKHEGDALHLAEIVLRMADGQWPHLDFMTPIGILAMAPIALFVHLGWGIGHAIFLAQLMVALILFLPTLYTVRSRIGGWPGVAYAAYVMILCLALVHGETEQSVSISMHYNRWAWAIAYVIVPLALLPPREGAPRGWLEGGLIGLGLAALVLIKVTYFVSLAPAILIALIARRWWGVALWAALAGLVAAGVMTALGGVGFWLAYLHDLATVSGSEVRAAPGMDFPSVAAAPTHVGASFALLAAVIFLRQAGRMAEGLALMVLVPGLIFITYQNFGNDPQWLVMLAVFALVLRPAAGTVNGRGWDLRQGLTYAGFAACAFALPSLINLAYSPLRHQFMATKNFVPLLPGRPDHADLLADHKRLYSVITTAQGDGPGAPFAAYYDRADHPKQAVLNGEKLPYCEQLGGLIAWFDYVTKDLTQAGYAGKGLITADFYASYWLFGDFRPVKGAAPWYYGGLSGIEDADYIVVPTCPIGDTIRRLMLDEIKEKGISVTEVRRTPVYILLQPMR